MDPALHWPARHCQADAYTQTHIESQTQGFPDGSVVKNPPAPAGDTGSIPDRGRTHILRGNSLSATTTEPVP